MYSVDDKLPLEHPFKEAFAIYGKRLAIFFTVVYWNLALLGLVVGIAKISIKPSTSLAVALALLAFVVFLFSLLTARRSRSVMAHLLGYQQLSAALLVPLWLLLMLIGSAGVLGIIGF